MAPATLRATTIKFEDGFHLVSIGRGPVDRLCLTWPWWSDRAASWPLNYCGSVNRSCLGAKGLPKEMEIQNSGGHVPGGLLRPSACRRPHRALNR